MPFDKDAELDPRLSGLALTAIYSKYEQQFAGRDLTASMKQHAQGDDAKISTRIDKAIKAALADVELLVETVAADGNEELPSDVGNDKLLLEIYWRLHDTWKAETPPALKMLEVSDNAPVWTDVLALFGELEALDHDGGDGDSFPSEWYDDLLTRFEARAGKPKKRTAPKKAAPPIKEPPPDAQILDYSPKSTFHVGQWVRHPKFGVGYVIDSSQHATLEFGADRKVLAHVMAPPPAIEVRQRPRKPTGNTSELARAAGIEIKKVPARFDEEK
ncbi:MAG: hypothetical protein H0X17_14660 [Deltaproteobacteria bacterium]|nr:hypothetical protein [Deltaproteobacteria bacterium]